jgi:hypothetical protein
VFCEVGAESQIRRAVQAGEKAIHHCARQQFQVVDPREYRGIEELGAA